MLGTQYISPTDQFQIRQESIQILHGNHLVTQFVFASFQYPEKQR